MGRAGLTALFALASARAIVLPAAPVLEGSHRPYPARPITEPPSGAAPPAIHGAPLFTWSFDGQPSEAASPDSSGVATARTSPPFAWGGATWELVCFLSGGVARGTGAGAGDHRASPGGGPSASAYASVYVRLVGDSRVRPLPRRLSFTVTARHKATGRVLASRRCEGHAFSLPPSEMAGAGSGAAGAAEAAGSAAQPYSFASSWGFARFCRASLLTRGVELEVRSLRGARTLDSACSHGPLPIN
jgi:hypothetical protein